MSTYSPLETGTDGSTGSSGTEQTRQGLPPRDWKLVRLDTVAKRGSGHTPDKEHPEYWGGTIKWISLADSDRLDQVYISETAQTITPAGIAHSSAVVHPAGTVVLSRDAGIGKSAITTEEMAVSQHFMAWRCGPDLERLFLYYWLQSKKSEFERIAAGNTIKTIGLPYFRLLEIPLPPINEQRAISRALLDIDESIKAQGILIAKKRSIKLATMQQLLTGKIRLPGFHGEWEEKQLGALFDFSGGYSASRDQLSDEGYCYLHYGDIHTSPKVFVDVKAQYQDIPKLNIALKRIPPKSMLRDGDIVFVDASEDDEGTSKHVVVVNADNTPFVSGLHTIVAKSKTAELTHEYRRYCFQTAAIKKQFLFYSVGTKVSGISKTNIAKLVIPVPSIPEQIAIAAILSDMDAEIAALERGRDKAQAIKQGMMQQLLTGRSRLV